MEEVLRVQKEQENLENLENLDLLVLLDMEFNDQFAKTQRPPSPRQQRKGKTRLRPIDAMSAKWDGVRDKWESQLD